MDEYLVSGMELSGLFYGDPRDCTPYSLILIAMAHRECSRDSPDVVC